MNVVLRIERVVLDGIEVAPSSESRLQTAMEGELRRLIAAEGTSPLFANGGDMASVRGSEVVVGERTAPAALGRSVAQAVHAGLKQ
jgi:hypothetical protein